MPDTETFDVIVLGSGIAGLAAALSAHEHGLRAIMVEKSDRIGGTTSDSYGLIWAGGNHLMRQAGEADPREDIVRYMTFLGGGELSEERMIALVDRSPDAIAFFEFVRHPVPADRRAGRSLFRRRRRRARPGPHAGGRSDFRLRAWRVARQGARAEGRADLRYRRRAIRLGRDQPLLHLGPRPGARAPREGHARQGRRTGDALPQGAAGARRPGAARRRGRKPDRRERPRHRRAADRRRNRSRRERASCWRPAATSATPS